eukprot:GEMP01005435.1.p1 GENE.GEMP01005435.1~~GEMP01005435.1.p1  ORF type:complete len:782 (+),score=170.50 GEMP01005435.1:132-2477(+)
MSNVDLLDLTNWGDFQSSTTTHETCSTAHVPVVVPECTPSATPDLLLSLALENANGTPVNAHSTSIRDDLLARSPSHNPNTSPMHAMAPISPTHGRPSVHTLAPITTMGSEVVARSMPDTSAPAYGTELFADLDPVKPIKPPAREEETALPMMAPRPPKEPTPLRDEPLLSTAVDPLRDEPLLSRAELDMLSKSGRETLADVELLAYAPGESSRRPLLNVASSSDLLDASPVLDDFDPVRRAEEEPIPARSTSAVEVSEPAAVGPLLGLFGAPLIGEGCAEPKSPTSPIEQGEFRPAVDDDQVVLEDIEKKNIVVYDKGEKHRVGWYADTCKADIKEAILCACDAIMNSGFVLREVLDGDAEDGEGVDGRVFEFEDFDQLASGRSYILEPAKDREDLKDITGDRMRRLKIQVEPMLHVEAQKAIDNMRRGANLLKHTRYGFPHLRQFQLSEDRRRLLWYSGAKRKEDSVINIDTVEEIMLGQQTPVFSNYRLPMLEHLSFSIKHLNGKTLDITCKDEFEFDHWVTGLKALLYHNKNRLLSKAELLAHSKRFRKALEKNNCAIKLTTLPEVKEKGHVGLDDCIEIMSHTAAQLESKLDRLRERLKLVAAQVSKLDFHASAEMEIDVAILTGQGPAYASVFREDEESQDEEMEIRRMVDLTEETSRLLQTAQNELLALQRRQEEEGDTQASGTSAASSEEKNRKEQKKKNAKSNKHIDQLLWKAEVDLENVEDMYARHIDNQRETTLPFSASIAEFNSRVSQTVAGIGDELTLRFPRISQWFT